MVAIAIQGGQGCLRYHCNRFSGTMPPSLRYASFSTSRLAPGVLPRLVSVCLRVQHLARPIIARLPLILRRQLSLLGSRRYIRLRAEVVEPVRSPLSHIYFEHSNLYSRLFFSSINTHFAMPPRQNKITPKAVALKATPAPPGAPTRRQIRAKCVGITYFRTPLLIDCSASSAKKAAKASPALVKKTRINSDEVFG